LSTNKTTIERERRMKKLLLVILALCLTATPVFADYCNWQVYQKVGENYQQISNDNLPMSYGDCVDEANRLIKGASAHSQKVLSVKDNELQIADLKEDGSIDTVSVFTCVGE